MLDVHILQMSYTPEAYKRQAIESCRTAADMAGFPVAIHVTEGIPGHLGKARKKGYSFGEYPYVTHVDDDDFVESNAFSILKPHLEKGVDSLTTGETHIYDGGKKISQSPKMRHHLAVFKRIKLEELSYDEFTMFPDQYILSMFDSEHIPECVYNHRIEQSSGSRKQRTANKERAKLELALINRPDLAVVENMSPLAIAVSNDRFLRNQGT